MKNPQRLGLLFLKTTLLSFVVAGTGIGLLYHRALQAQVDLLTTELERRVSFIRSTAETNEEPAAILQAVEQDLETNPLDPELGALWIAQLETDEREWLLGEETATVSPPLTTLLGGEAQTVVNWQTIAAYEPIEMESLNWGVLLHTPLREFSNPYIQVAVITAIVALLASALLTMLYWAVSRQSLTQLVASEQRHRQIVENAAEGVITINNQAIVETFNPAAERMFGYGAKQVIGRTIDSIMLAFAEGEVEAALFGTDSQTQRMTNSGSIQKTSTTKTLSPLVAAKRELMGQRQDGTIFPVELAISRLSQGSQKRFLLLVRDISDRKQIEETLRKRTEELELRVEERTHQLTHLNEELLHEIAERNNVEENFQATEKRFRTLFNQAEVGIIQTTKTGAFVRVNPRFLDLLSYTEDLVIGQTFQDFTYPDDLGHVVSQFRQLLAGEIPELSVQQRYLRADGSPLWVQVSGSVVRDLVGDVEYFMAVVEDISEQMDAKAALMASESTLSSFFSTTSMMMGIVEVVDGDIRHLQDNAATSEFFRLSPVTMRNQMASALGVPAEIRSYWVDHCLESARKGGAVRFEYAYEPDFDHEGLGPRWLAATVAPIAGQARFSYIVEDITAQRQQAELLQIAQAQLQDSTSQLDEHRQEILKLAELNEYLQASRTKQDAFDAIAELVSPLFAECSGAVYVLNDTGNLEAITHWGAQFNSKLLFAPDDSWAVRRGRAHWVDHEHPRLLSPHIERNSEQLETLSVPMIAQGQLQGLLYLTSSTPGVITEPKRHFAQTVAEQLGVSLANVGLRSSLKADPVHDLLTSLFTRRYLEESLEREVYGAARQSRNLGLLLLDIDHFRQYNNTFGHEAGDIVLKTLSHFVQRTLQSNDIAARFGGEEIAILLPELTLEALRDRAEQLREGVKHLHYEGTEQRLDGITVSIGVAIFPENGMTWEALIHSAEMALSRAKVEGRDRVCTVQG